LGFNPSPERKSREAGFLPSEFASRTAGGASAVPNYHRRPPRLAGVARNYCNHNAIRAFGDSAATLAWIDAFMETIASSVYALDLWLAKGNEAGNNQEGEA
jgi:hypothetical protein